MQKAQEIKPNAMYVGIFATDPKGANKIVKNVCKQALFETLKFIMPQSYLKEGQVMEKPEKPDLGVQLTEKEKETIQNDFINYQNFNTPKDNYHITCLFIGKNREKLCKQDKQALSHWKNGNKQPIKVDFIVYVPNYMITGFASSLGNTQCSNKFPHMTLLLKDKASPVESNDILSELYEKAPQIFQKRQKRVTILNIAYRKVSRIMIVIDFRFQLEGVTGDNCSCGKK